MSHSQENQDNEKQNSFEQIRFHGTFRDYQQRVLDNVEQYAEDGKINIVAAPGSGKTVLGLELIRRLGAPCVILSPTTAIREQWGERFKELFLDDENRFESLFSNDLHTVRLLNSITYQALYSAMEKVDSDETDYSDVDLFATMRKYGIKTVCLDEAHHLKNEWQKALEKFIATLDGDVKLISLTATPPYDSEGAEWARYSNLCGEIDEEIFVPELVKEGTLCPHQDYIYFNYPTEAESASFDEQRRHADAAVEEIGTLPWLRDVSQKLNEERNYEVLFESVKEYTALLVLFRHYYFEISKDLIRELTAEKELPPFSMQYAETAIQFLLDGDLLIEEQKSEIVGILKQESVYEKRKVTLDLNDKLKRTLMSSLGKLESIRQIVKSEKSAMGYDLHMLILTDYIKKENLSKIATEETFDSVNVVSIFETLRRVNYDINIGVLSGSLVILPDSLDLSSMQHKKTVIPGTNYCTVEFSGSNHSIVNFVGQLFEEGQLQVLIGTKSLLGEGWDSPCINSLILASFVGSFVQSNQMRGRAIRVDKKNPDKSANIWHLVTVEPHKLMSYDYELLERRFETFMGPNYTTDVIESGIERITAIKPPYDRAGIDRINREMLSRSCRRNEIRDKWKGEVNKGNFAVKVETRTPKEKRVPVFTFSNAALSVLLTAVDLAMLYDVWNLIGKGKIPHSAVLIAAILFLSGVLGRKVKKMIRHANPAHSIKTLGTAVYNTLCECGLIDASAKVETNVHEDISYVALSLNNASVHDQNVFNAAMTEMLSPIENPKYILIAKNSLNQYIYELSFACPSIIGKKKEYALILAEQLRAETGNFDVVYTYKENGRKLLLDCKRSSYITHNERAMGKKYVIP